MNVSLKRRWEASTEIESIEPNKKQKTSFFTLAEVSTDLIDRICNFLEFEDLAALSSTSKEWSVITADTPFWRNLCIQAKLFPASHQQPRTAFLCALKNNIVQAQLIELRCYCESKYFIIYPKKASKALAKLHAILLNREISANVKLEVTLLIKLMQVVYTYMKSPMAVLSDAAAVSCLKEIIDSNVLPSLANVLLGFFRLQNRTQFPTLDQTFTLLENLSQHKPSRRWIRELASYGMSIMRYRRHTNRIDDNQAFTLMLNYCLSSVSLSEYRKFAMLSIAQMELEKRTNRFDDQKIISWCKLILKDISPQHLARAGILIAEMRLKKKIQVIDDSQIVALLQKICQAPQTKPQEQSKAELLLKSFAQSS